MTNARIFPRAYEMIWSSYFHINSRMISHLRVGRVLLGGDAAHIHSPAGEQGMNTGIQDMINLSWKLAYSMKGYGTPELLDTYQSDRIPMRGPYGNDRFCKPGVSRPVQPRRSPYRRY
jgi:2-polyprenyl-6-methoxyphenol hydroxylase-like FAD-dependent oxidoreductase